MSIFIRKLSKIEAFVWTGGPDQTEDPEWAIQAIRDKVIFFSKDDEDNTILCIKTKVGLLVAEQGDYITKEEDSSISTYNKKLFEQLYEPI